MKKIPRGPSVKPIAPVADVLEMYKSSEISDPSTAAELFVWGLISVKDLTWIAEPGKFYKIQPTLMMDPSKFIIGESAREDLDKKDAELKAIMATVRASKSKDNIDKMRQAVEELKMAKEAVERTLISVEDVPAESLVDLDEDERTFVETLKASCEAKQNSFDRLLDFTFCYLIKGFKDANMKQYYAAAKMKVVVKPLMDYVHYFSSTPVKILEDPDLQERITSIEWTSYHSTLSSTVGLINKVMVDFKGNLEKLLWNALSPEANSWYFEAKKPENRFNPKAFSDPPTDLVAFAAIYLEATGGYPPNKWWQGEKAVSEVGEAFRVKAALVAEMMVKDQTKLVKMSGDNQLAIAGMSRDVSAEAQGVVLDNAATLSLKELETGIKAAAAADNEELFKEEYERRKNQGKAKA